MLISIKQILNHRESIHNNNSIRRLRSSLRGRCLKSLLTENILDNCIDYGYSDDEPETRKMSSSIISVLKLKLA